MNEGMEDIIEKTNKRDNKEWEEGRKGVDGEAMKGGPNALVTHKPCFPQAKLGIYATLEERNLVIAHQYTVEKLDTAVIAKEHGLHSTTILGIVDKLHKDKGFYDTFREYWERREAIGLRGVVTEIRENINVKRPSSQIKAIKDGVETTILLDGRQRAPVFNITVHTKNLQVKMQEQSQLMEEILGPTGKLSDIIDVEPVDDDAVRE